MHLSIGPARPGLHQQRQPLGVCCQARHAASALAWEHSCCTCRAVTEEDQIGAAGISETAWSGFGDAAPTWQPPSCGTASCRDIETLSWPTLFRWRVCTKSARTKKKPIQGRDYFQSADFLQWVHLCTIQQVFRVLSGILLLLPCSTLFPLAVCTIYMARIKGVTTPNQQISTKPGCLLIVAPFLQTAKLSVPVRACYGC
jgi:hypothetical protein